MMLAVRCRPAPVTGRRRRAGGADGGLGADGPELRTACLARTSKAAALSYRRDFLPRGRNRPGHCGNRLRRRIAVRRPAAAPWGLWPVAWRMRYVACGAGVDKDWRRWAVDTLLAAIDGGGSSTRVWVLSATGELLAEGRSGPSTVTVVGAEAAGRAVAEAARAAGLSAGDWPGGGANVAVVAAIMAGVETEPEYSQFLAELQRRFPDSAVVLRHDA